MKTVLTEISGQVLLRIIGIPDAESYRVVNASVNELSNVLTICIESDKFKDVPAGGNIPYATINIRTGEDGEREAWFEVMHVVVKP